MTEEKQIIEDMAKCCTYYHNGECCADATKICDCDLMCEMFGVFANLDNAGYRKQSDIIDEFAERLKKCLYDNPTIFTQQRYIVVDEINNLVAKMKGGE